MKDAPRSYKDPLYASLDAGIEQKLGLPSGLLSTIRTHGERSNADQVSEAGAKSVYQIIPATRDAVLKKYGIDAYLSPQNAAEAAGLLLKEGLDRNKGDAALAAAEYHGGTDRANWGPRTKAYVERVRGALGAAQDDSLISDMQAWKQRSAAQAPAASTAAVDDELISAAKAWKGSRPAPQERGFIAGVKETITGTDRTTPEVQAALDTSRTIYDMPESNELSIGVLKSAVGGLFANSKERAQIFAANFPGVTVREDEQGNQWIKSAKDGQEYVIPPGLKLQDTPRAVATVAAFTPAGRATTIPGMALASAGTQAAIEATQAATGGEFNPGEVATAGIVGAAVPTAVNSVKAAARPVRQAIQRAAGRAAPAAAPVSPASQAATTVAQAMPDTVPMPQATPAAAPPTTPAVQPMPAQELAQTAKKAAEGGIGSTRARQVLVEQAMPDSKVLEAAKRLGIDDYLQPDHVTTNQAYRELAQAVKSVPGSEARAVELQGLEKIAKRADDLIDEIGGTQDVSMLDAGVKSRLQATHRELEAQADDLYKQIREGISAGTEAPATNVLKFIKKRVKDLGGEQNLSPMERSILAKLEPKAKVPHGHGHGKPQTEPQGIVDQFGLPMKPAAAPAKKQPTYALLDDVRKDLGAAARMAGPFKDADTGLSKKLYSLLSDDQAAVVANLGMSDTYNAARTAVAVRKGLEDDLAALFGKNIDGSLVGNLSGAVRALPSGDASKLVRLLKAIPEDMRQDVVASGLNTAFGKTARNGQLSFSSYAKWYEGLLRNKQAYTALMSNLPRQARKQLSDLYRVSKGISAATRERITTGRIQAVADELKGADTLMANIYGFAKRASVGAAAEAVTTPIGLPGAGIASGITSALAKGKPNAVKAADALIASPEFINLAKQAGKPGEKAATLRLVHSKNFTRYVRAIGQPRELSNRERWVLQSMQAQNQQQR